jgi:hypothetical protein
MKNTMRVFILILLTIFIFQCKKEQPIEEPPYYNGFSKAKVNGVDHDFMPHMQYFPAFDRYALDFKYIIKVGRCGSLNMGFGVTQNS